MATIALPSPPPDASATVKGLVNTVAQTVGRVRWWWNNFPTPLAP